MNKVFTVILLSLALAGCSTPYGNFVKSSAGLDEQQIASDTVKQLSILYPAAKTRFEIKQSIPKKDEFGITLVRSLRERGYALLEFDAKAKQSKHPQSTIVNGISHIPLRYVLDHFTGTHLYRVTIMLGNQSITRPYSMDGDTIVPAGSWIRKE